MKKYKIKEALSNFLVVLLGIISAILAIFLGTYLRGDRYLAAYTHFLNNDMFAGVCERLQYDTELASGLGYDEGQKFNLNDLKEAYIIDLYNVGDPVLMCFMSNDFGDVYTIIMHYRDKGYYFHDTVPFSACAGSGASEYHLLVEDKKGDIYLYDYDFSKDGEGNILKNATLYNYGKKDTPVYSFRYDSKDASNCLENGVVTDKTVPDESILKENYSILVDSRNYGIYGSAKNSFRLDLDKFWRG